MLTEAILLDISQAERQIRELERELDRLNEPVRVPIDIEGERAADELRRDFSNADVAVADLNAELAETDRELDRVRTSADRAGRELETTGRRGVTSFNGMAVAAGAFGVALAAAVGVRAFVGFAGQAIDAASDFEESLSKSRVVFGNFSDDIERFATTGPQALGLANREALAFTATFGNLFVALGLSQEAAAELSPQIVQLGADLASFNNIDVAEALEKLRSGLVGEAEPLRTLGVNINESVTQAKALELGLGGLNGELSEAEKVQARYALILEQTVTAQGDFARTADGIANRQQTLRAQFEDLRAEIGEALVPAFERLLELAPQILAAFEDVVPVIESFGVAVAGVDPSGLGDAVQLLTEIPQSGGSLLDIITGIGGAFAGLNPLVVAARGDFGLFADSLNQVDDALQGIENRKIINNLINDIQAGQAPVASLVEGLRKLATQDLNLEDFETLALALVEISGVDTTDINGLRNALRPGFLGFSAEEIRVLRRELGLLSAEAVFSPEAFRRLGREVEDTVIPITEGAQAILDYVAAGKSLEDFAPDLGAEGIQEQADTLGTALDGAAEALRTKEGEIVDDLDTFISNLSTVFEDQLDFARNISVLRARGLDELADVFEEAGLEAAGALADAVTDPAAAQEANDKIATQGQELAQAQFAAFDTEIKQLIAGYEPDAVVIPLTFGGLPDIPISAITAGGIVPIPGRAGATEITTNIIVDSNEDLPSAASRAVQIINSGVNASRSGPS